MSACCDVVQCVAREAESCGAESPLPLPTCATVTFLQDFFSRVEWGRVALYLFLSTFVLGSCSTWLRDRLQWEDGYSRKINHVGVMLLSAPLLAFLPKENLYPSVAVSAVGVTTIYAISACSTQPLIHGIVAGSLRKRDAPNSRFFFFFPLISFDIALILAGLILPLDVVRTAFFTVAVADGFAEPVGLYLGRNNTYHVRDMVWGGKNRKSIAGSSTVLFIALAVAILALSQLHPLAVGLLAASLGYAIAITAVEACSPRGFDNMLLVLIGSVVLPTMTWLFM
jgi:dolichol kinase